MDTTHRKIELQSLDDLSYLIANVQKAAQEVIDSHIPLPSTSFAGGGSSSEHVSRQTNRAKKDGSANEDHQMQRKEVEEIVNGVCLFHIILLLHYIHIELPNSVYFIG